MRVVQTLLFISATLIFLTPMAPGELTIYHLFEKELINETVKIPIENYNFLEFYISLTGKTQNRVTVSVHEVNGNLLNIYLFDEENFQLYKEGKTAGPIFSARVVTTYSKIFVPEKSGNYFLVIENNDPFRKTAHVKVVWKYGVAASDLIPEFVEAHPSEIFWGEKLYIDFKIKNFSPVKAGAHEVVVYLEGEDGKLYEIDRIQNEQVPPEEVKTFSSEKVISKELPRGLYRIKIVVDPKDQVEEHNETNNEVYGAKIFVKGEMLRSTKPFETKTTPGFELLLTLTALLLIALLHRKRKI